MAERRGHERRQTGKSADVEVFMKQEVYQTEVIEAHSQDISKRGLKLVIPDIYEALCKKLLFIEPSFDRSGQAPLNQGRYIKACPVIPPSNPFQELSGRIAGQLYSLNKSACLCGIYFEAISPHEQKVIRNYIDCVKCPKCMQATPGILLGH